MFCIECGQQLGEDSKFCFVCGAKTEPEQIPQEENIPPADESPQIYEEVQAAPVPTHIPIQPAVSMPQFEQDYEEPQEEEIVYASGHRRILLAVLAVVLLAVIAVVAFFVIRGRNDANVPAPPPRAQDVHTPPPAQTGVSIHHIERVFYGRLLGHPGETIGAAFSRYFTDYEWSHFLDGNTNTVSFFGLMHRDGDDEPIGVQIMFRFTAGDADFDATGLFLGGYWQEASVLRELLASIFEDANG